MTTSPRGPAEEPEVFNPDANNFVKTVTDDPADNMAEIERRVNEGLFGYTPGVHQEYVRDFLRPANRGQGRARNR